jgi:hypothetical protein
MFRKLRTHAAVATITAVAAITVASAAPASAATNSPGTPVVTATTQPATSQADGSYFWGAVQCFVIDGAQKAVYHRS